jgi:hypothetical protein
LDTGKSPVDRGQWYSRPEDAAPNAILPNP